MEYPEYLTGEARRRIDAAIAVIVLVRKNAMGLSDSLLREEVIRTLQLFSLTSWTDLVDFVLEASATGYLVVCRGGA